MLQVDTSQLSLYLTNTGVPDFVVSLLSRPQILLVYMYKTKNSIQNILSQQKLVLEELLNSLKYVKNTEKTLTTNLTEAKTVLTRFDSSGQIDVDKYKEKIMSFLKDANVKSGSSEQFGKTNIDAQEDIFVGVQSFLALQRTVADLIATLSNVREDIASITILNTILRNLSSFNISRLTDLDSSKNDISKVGLVIDLFSSITVFDYLSSLANFSDTVFAPLVSKTIPADKEIMAKSEEIRATAISNTYPQTISHNDFRITVDGTPMIIDFPSTSAKGRAYVLASQASPTFNIPANTRLYLKVNCPSPPATHFIVPEGFLVPEGYIEILLPSGTQTFGSIASTITAGMNTLDTSFVMTQFGFCEHFGSGTTNRLMIYGKSDVTSIEVMPTPGSYNHLTGVYTSALESAHDSLFLSLGASQPINKPLFLDIVDRLNLVLPSSLEDNRIRITSPTTGVSSSLTFQTSISTDIGFVANSPQPTKFKLVSKGEILNPLILGLYNGCLLNGVPITIDGTDIIYPGANGTFEVSIFPDCIKILNMVQYLKSYKGPSNFEKIWTPIMNGPTNVQIEEARVFTSNLRDSISTLLSALSLQIENSFLMQQANQILNLLESRGLSILQSNLTNSEFSKFFNNALNMDNSSYGLNLMSTIEKGVKND